VVVDLMARKRRQAQPQGQMGQIPQQGMRLGNTAGAGVIDATALPPRRTTLQEWGGWAIDQVQPRETGR
jgi:hypothetical protein